MNQPIRVLIVDDSAVVRGLLSKTMESDPELVVAGSVMNGERALAWLSGNAADVVLLDVEMPVMDGLTTLNHLQQKHPHIKTIMVSSLTESGGNATVKALSMGAAGCVAKPRTNGIADSIELLCRELLPLIKAVGQRVNKGSDSKISSGNPGWNSKPSHLNSRSASTPEVVVIGSSTGGPKALQDVLTALPVDFPIPILIVQHMPATFTPILAKHLTRDTQRPCMEAVNGTVIEPNHTYIAPGDFHLEVANQNHDGPVLRLNQNPPEHFCRPSVNPLFRTVADTFGDRVLAVMLTGMGHDGVEGTREIVMQGGHVIA
ncbi:MAG: chemotaxis-specific protein-glutamate methyltransferase CheB, partial [Planctomycetaceae bacterium]|nr:chemotaxis-specific protein-glutamate methyltransferase CheB [Planctomycetaceae bacterium]